MFRNFLNCIEAMIRAVSYLLILIIGLTATTLGAFFVVMLAYRLWQLFWFILFKESWL